MKRSRIKPVGKRKTKEIAETQGVRADYRESHPWCEIGYVMTLSDVDSVKKWYRTNCTGRSECVHERKKRSAGGSLVDPVNLLAACSNCNSWVEDHPALAKSMGLVVSSYEDAAAIPVERYEP
jgi:hypothetical protein